MTSRSFLLTHIFKDVSKLDEGGSYYSDIEIRHDISWKIRIFKKEEFLGVNLHCEKEECFGERKWSFQTKFTMKLVAVSEKFFRRTVQYEFQKPEGHGMNKFISWENMLRDYVDNDSIIIEIHADIVSSAGFFKIKCKIRFMSSTPH
ncbi:MATH domain-containing protein [Caenorhabditis elegans]|uniref:MATH domain-containing protein n=1 Tax=Caenorhabditis elegans TaxID=6239 RepID=O76559_CAEEL|nr:MATH domain-containing protein [Caenorhabditis elegans]CCD67121.2 MATH domain-containing protein [Caenorhabditis elegans]|eukprot:NP_494147.2 MATH (meprin-associated Traf homology) domain containing [Caenorhabditis elegans]